MPDRFSSPPLTREAWLEFSIEKLRPWFWDILQPLPDRIRVSIGFPHGNKKAIGQCWLPHAVSDGIHHIYISPQLHEPGGEYGILATLIHECCHAALASGARHGKSFQRTAAAMGLHEPWTATGATPALLKRIEALLPELPPWPISYIIPGAKEKKERAATSAKCVCGECGYTARVSLKWLSGIGAPHCPEHGEMSIV